MSLIPGWASSTSNPTSDFLERDRPEVAAVKIPTPPPSANPRSGNAAAQTLHPVKRESKSGPPKPKSRVGASGRLFRTVEAASKLLLFFRTGVGWPRTHTHSGELAVVTELHRVATEVVGCLGLRWASNVVSDVYWWYTSNGRHSTANEKSCRSEKLKEPGVQYRTRARSSSRLPIY
jgi:hypothetical protein